ncbi:uncharacterized protein LOC122520583 [Polistes fuscatus]|uniref:uncharacterized protein LOC122520583 n=1 Tax=Polistes fuscatus TaxID=30207 RepID=UPI001CA9957D|nr:uncharacterized protein LOC122520583 [Polistes fuscatus]XP_043496620.1 uncharacterized protein LOC122520583 [Polistes fuscatus]
MQASLSRKMIGCIGKCTSGLKREELDQITDNIIKTLTDPRGRQIFRRYLEQRDLHDNLECLDLYETCSEFIEKEQNTLSKDLNLEGLQNDVRNMKELLEDLDGVPQIDLALLERFNDALNSESRITMLAVMEDTRERLTNHLRRAHGSFKRYASEPCPLTK